MKKSLFTFCLAIGLLSNSLVKAQTRDTVKTKGWFKHEIAGAAQIQVTYRKCDLGDINAILNANGLPSMSGNNIWINASMLHIKNQWIMEDGIGFTPFSTSETSDIKAHYNQYQAFFRLGYNISKSTDYRLYPFAGINFSEAVFHIQDKTGERAESDFSGELLNQTANKTLYQPNFGVELGAGFDYVIKLKPKQMDCFTLQRNIPIGLRVGYYIHAASGDWKIDDYKLQNSPDKKQSAVFVSLNIGLGYAIKK